MSKIISSNLDDYATPTEDPIEGDGVLMIGRGRTNHIGIVCFINKQLYILHAMRNAKITVLHQLIELKHSGLIVEGYYKWK